MKELLPIAFIFLSACNSYKEKKPTELDSLPIGITDAAEYKQHFIDSVINHGKEMAADMDLASNAKCPVKVSVSLSNEEYNRKGFHLTMTNSSDKTVDAIEVNIICYDNFDEQVQDGAAGTAYVNVKYQEKIRPESSKSADYSSIYFKEATKGKPFVSRIHFTDGSVWKKE